MIISLGIGGYILYSSSNKETEPSYSAFTLEPLDPLVLKGEVKAMQTEDIFYDQALELLHQYQSKTSKKSKQEKP
ncbi:hypothetical protein GQR36_06000 [Enterococcus termitis]